MAIAEAEKNNQVLSSHEIALIAQAKIDDYEQNQRRRNEYNVLSSKNAGSRVMKPITTLNALTQPVLRDLVVSSAAEFLGEEFWLSLNTMSEKLLATRVYNHMRERLTRGMC